MEFRKVLCNELSALMKENEKIVILDADLAKPDGIYPLFLEFPERCFQVGIAESNMAGLCAGLSAYGYIPVMVTFAPFAITFFTQKSAKSSSAQTKAAPQPELFLQI